MKKDFISNRITQYEENKAIVESGKFKHVPFYGFNKLQTYVPGIVPGIMYKVTSHTGMGKTSFSKYLFVYQTMLYAIKNNINFKVIYLALEESEEEFLDDLFRHIVMRLKNIQLDKFSLMGASSKVLDKKELDAIKECQEVVSQISNNIFVIDNVYTADQMYSVCKKFASNWGKFDEDEDGNVKSYTPYDENQIVLVVADHISLISEQYDSKNKIFLDKRKVMSRWHTEICKREITKVWNWAVLNIQQQSMESATAQYTSRGDSIIDKVLPSIDGLADNKIVARDDYVILGLFGPNHYNFEKYLGYPIKDGSDKAMGDNFRSLHFIKNRFGATNKIIATYFNGAYTYFKELPKPDDPSMDYFYNKIKKET